MSISGQDGINMENENILNKLNGMKPKQLAALGNQLMAQRRFDDAAAVFQKQRDLNPQDGNLLNSLGAALFMAGWQDMAIECQREAIRFKPENATFRVNLAKMLMVARRWDEAASSMEAALGKNGGAYKNGWYDLLNYCREMMASSQAETGFGAGCQIAMK